VSELKNGNEVQNIHSEILELLENWEETGSVVVMFSQVPKKKLMKVRTDRKQAVSHIMKSRMYTHVTGQPWRSTDQTFQGKLFKSVSDTVGIDTKICIERCAFGGVDEW
jgi:hypothetical protein